MKNLIKFILLLCGLEFLSNFDVDTAEYLENSCPYFDTVNITGYPRLQDGSYQYHDIIVPEKYTNIHDKIILYKNEERSVPNHTRACICQLKPCIKMCSGPNTALFMGKKEENLDSDNNIIEIMDSKTGVLKHVSIINFFAVQEGRSCEILYELTQENDTHTIFENGTLLLLNNKKYLNKDEYCLSSIGYDYKNTTVHPHTCPIPSDDRVDSKSYCK